MTRTHAICCVSSPTSNIAAPRAQPLTQLLIAVLLPAHTVFGVVDRDIPRQRRRSSTGEDPEDQQRARRKEASVSAVRLGDGDSRGLRVRDGREAPLLCLSCETGRKWSYIYRRAERTGGKQPKQIAARRGRRGVAGGEGGRGGEETAVSWLEVFQMRLFLEGPQVGLPAFYARFISGHGAN